jgi:hypothetical protein
MRWYRVQEDLQAKNRTTDHGCCDLSFTNVRSSPLADKTAKRHADRRGKNNPPARRSVIAQQTIQSFFHA